MEFVDDEAQRTVTVLFRSFLATGEYTHRIVYEVHNGEHTPPTSDCRWYLAQYTEAPTQAAVRHILSFFMG